MSYKIICKILSFFIFLFCFALRGYSQPANDNKASATNLAIVHQWCSANAAYTNNLATSDGPSVACWAGDRANNVWFKFVATTNAVKVDIKTGGVFGTMRGQQVAIWNSINALVACNDAGWNYNGTLSLSIDTLKTGNTYYISVDDQTTHGTFSLCLDDAAGYDMKSGALLLGSIHGWCSSDAQFDNTLATRDGAAGTCWNGGTDHNIWFKFVATTNAIKADLKTGGTYGTMRGQQVAIWNSANILVACNDAGWNYNGTLSLSIDTLKTGNTYYISVDDQTTHGTFSLCVDDAAGYDMRSGALLLSSVHGWCSSDAQYDNILATRDGAAGTCWNGGTDHNVWFKFVATTNAIKADLKTGGTYGTMRGQQIAVWNAAGTQVACGDAGWNFGGTLTSSIDTLKVGNTYYISVDDETTHGTFSLCMDDAASYDMRSGALLINSIHGWCSADAVYDNTFATGDGSAGTCWNGGTDHNVWFKFVATTNAVKADLKTGGTYGTMRGQQVAIWNNAGVQVACNDAGWNYSGTLSTSMDTLKAGNTYYISVDDETTHGTFSLCIDDAVSYDFKSGAVTLSILDNWCSADAQYDNIFATADGSAGSCWNGGTDHNVWFKFIAETNAVKVDIKTGGTYGTMRGQQVAIWNAAGVQVACNDAGWNYNGTLSLGIDTLKAGNTYYISVDDETTHGTFSLCINNGAGYDFKSGAQYLYFTDNWCSTDAQYDNTFATRDGAAGSCWNGGTDHNVWFKFIAETGGIKVDIKTGGTYGTMRGQQIAIWNAAGTQLTCNDAGWNYSGTLSLSIDTLTAGNVYYISIDDETTHGSFSVCLNNKVGFDFKEDAVFLNDLDHWCSASAAYANTYATKDQSAGSCWNGGTDHNVWFKFVAVSGQIQVDVITGGISGTMRGQQIAIWNGNGQQLACIDAGWNYSGSVSLIVDTLMAGNTYYISVDDETTHGTFSLCANNKSGFDFKSGAILLPSIGGWCSSDAQYNNTFATADGSAGSCWNGGTDHNVWFKFVAGTNAAKVDIKTGGTYGTMRGQQIAIWNASGIQVACNDAGWNYSGTISLGVDTLTIGNTYYVSIDDETTHGTFSLCLDNVPGYDFKSGSLLLNNTNNWCSTDAQFDNSFATRDGLAGSCWNGGTDHNVWFNFIAATGAIKVDVKTGGTYGTMRGQQIAIWNAAGVQVACNDAGWNYNGTLSLSIDTLKVGNKYYISVDDETTHGTFSLCASNNAGYDFKNGALLLTDLDTWCSSNAQYDNSFASPDGSAGSCWNGGTDHNVWFKFVAISGQVNVDIKTGGVYGSMRGQQVALWNTAGTQLACNDAGWNYNGTLSLSIDTLVAGHTYYISVDDQTTHGTFSLCINNKVGFDFKKGAVVVTDLDHWCSASAAYANTYATADGSAGPCWAGGTDHNVWFSFTAVFDTATISITTGGASGTMRGQQIAVWNSTGVLVGCKDAGWNFSGVLSIRIDTLKKGNTYWISIDDQTTHGSFSLCLNNVSGWEYWSIANGNWNATSSWSRVDGGAPASTIPTAANIVHIKGYSITVSDNEACARLDMRVINNNTNLIIDNGNLQVKGRVNYYNNGANFSGDLQVKNGGNFLVDKDLIVARNGGNAAMAIDVTQNSTISVGEDLSFTSSAGTVTDNQVNISNTASLNITRDLLLINSGGPKITLTMNNTSILNVGQNVSYAAAIDNKLEIQMNGSSVLNLSGNFIIGPPAYGRFLCSGNATLVFKGTSFLQTWPMNTGLGTDGFTYQNVTINNTKVTQPQITLNGQVQVNGLLTFTNGIVSTTSTNLLIIANGASVSGASVSSYIDGPVRKTGNTAFQFPVGNKGNYQPVSISAPSVATDAYTAQYFYTNPHPTYNNTLRVPSLTNISECEYWSMTRNTGTSNVNITAGWNSNSCCISDLAVLRVGVWEGAQWTDHGNGGTTGTKSAGTITTASPLTQNSNIISFANTIPVVSFSGLAAAYCASTTSVILTGSPLGATGVFTGAGITNNGDGTAIFNPATAGAGTYTLTYTYTDPVNNCSNYQSQTVTVYALPKGSMTGTNVVCPGSKADLTMFFTGKAPWNYQYTDGTNTFSGSTATDPYTFQSNVIGTYSLLALSDANSCIGTDFGSSATISAYPALPQPIITTSDPTTFCEGGSATLSTAVSGIFAIWSSGQTTYSIAVTETGDYNVKIIDSHNCVSPISANTHITVNKKPRKPVPITGNTSICQNGPNSVLSTFSAYADTYNWSILPLLAGSFTGNSATNTLAWDPSFAGVATITVKGNNALCGDGPLSDPLVITVKAIPVDPGPITGTDTLCQGTSGVYYSISPVINATSYFWTVPPGASIVGIANGTGITVNYSVTATSGNITVRAINGCGNSLNISSLAIDVILLPETGPVYHLINNW
jgi:hypothetical protein